jgi:hypothetical protein
MANFVSHKMDTSKSNSTPNGSNPLFELPVEIDKLQKSNPKLGESLRQQYGQDHIELAILANTFLEKVTITLDD